MRIGYARVSTQDQNLQMQRDALKRAGCERVFEDHGVRGNALIKPQLMALLEFARAGDTIVVWRLDRLSRSLTDLLTLMEALKRHDLQFMSVTEAIETETPSGRLFFHLIGALSEFERDVIGQRTVEGLASAKASGVRLGRPPRLTDEKWEYVQRLKFEGWKIADIARLVGVSRQAIYDRQKKEAAGGAA